MSHKDREILWIFLLIRRRGRHPVVSVALVRVLCAAIGAPEGNIARGSRRRMKASIGRSSGGGTAQGGSRSRTCVGVGGVQGFLLLNDRLGFWILVIHSWFVGPHWCCSYPPRNKGIIGVVN
jgi:hypothetical protein